MPTPTDEPKFCRDCKHVVVDVMQGYKCYAPALGSDLVTGNRKRQMCEPARLTGGFCGPNGDHFEQQATA